MPFGSKESREAGREGVFEDEEPDFVYLKWLEEQRLAELEAHAARIEAAERLGRKPGQGVHRLVRIVGNGG